MTKTNYIFDNTKHRREKNRLKAIEGVQDASTRRRLLATGLKAGWRCLEVGPGAGSIMRWLAKRVGKSGDVIALDINPRFISQTRLYNVDVVQGDICRTQLPKRSFDLIHLRHVLIHTSNPNAAIRNMLTSLKPGGWMVLEEPDLSASRAIAGTPTECQAVRRVNKAMLTMFQKVGLDPGFGLQLPSLMQGHGLKSLAVENEAPISPGRSPMANVMNMSAQQLQDQYLATGEATLLDIRRYRQFTENLKSWAVYYGTVAVSGKKL